HGPGVYPTLPFARSGAPGPDRARAVSRTGRVRHWLPLQGSFMRHGPALPLHARGHPALEESASDTGNIWCAPGTMLTATRGEPALLSQRVTGTSSIPARCRLCPQHRDATWAHGGSIHKGLSAGPLHGSRGGVGCFRRIFGVNHGRLGPTAARRL